MNLHRASWLFPGTRLVVAMAPELTMGFVRPLSPASTAATELKARPVVDPELLARLVRSHGLAHEGEQKGLGHAHDRELVLIVPHLVEVAAGAHHAYPEEIGIRPRERRVDGGILAFGV